MTTRISTGTTVQIISINVLWEVFEGLTWEICKSWTIQNKWISDWFGFLKNGKLMNLGWTYQSNCIKYIERRLLENRFPKHIFNETHIIWLAISAHIKFSFSSRNPDRSEINENKANQFNSINSIQPVRWNSIKPIKLNSMNQFNQFN